MSLPRQLPSAEPNEELLAVDNYELDSVGELKKRRAQPTGALQNPHEPEAQWSSKSTTKDETWRR